VKVQPIILAAEQEKQVGGLAVRRAIENRLHRAPQHKEGSCEAIGLRSPGMEECHAARDSRRAEGLAGFQAGDQFPRIAHPAGPCGQRHQIAQKGSLRLGGHRRVNLLGPQQVRQEGDVLELGATAQEGFSVVLGPPVRAETEDSLRSPSVNVPLAKHQAVTARLERDVAIRDQPLNVRAGQAQILCDFVGVESVKGHGQWAFGWHSPQPADEMAPQWSHQAFKKCRRMRATSACLILACPILCMR
jgi:hypothetical protein